MRYLSGSKKLILVVIGVLGFLFTEAVNSVQVPPRPSPSVLVNNLSSSTNFLSPDETQALETKLDQFANNTSNQIAIVIVDSLNGYDISEFASEIGHQWQIGQKKFDNGVVILIKLGDDRKAFIATGYGLEGAIPDATCEEIIQNEMIPQFKRNNYYEGLDKATDVLIGLAKGEYNSKDYDKSNANSKSAGLIIAIVIILIVFIISRRGGGRGGYTIGNSGIFFWGGGLGGGGGGFGGGSGGGGFGGFGGGDFGGGGAGGSW